MGFDCCAVDFGSAQLAVTLDTKNFTALLVTFSSLPIANQMRSANAFSVLLKNRRPKIHKRPVASKDGRKLGQYSMASPPKMAQRKASITATMGFNEYKKKKCAPSLSRTTELL